jgi:hypothetical protein
VNSLPANLQDVLADLRPAAERMAADGRRRRRLRVIKVAAVSCCVGAAGALAASHYLGQPAPTFLKAELAEYDKGLPEQYRFYPRVEDAKVVAESGHAVLYAAAAAPRGGEATGRPGYCTDLVGDDGALGWNWVCNATIQVKGLSLHFAARDPRSAFVGETVAGIVVVPGARGLELRYDRGIVERIPLGLDGYFVHDIPADNLTRLRRGPATAVVRGRNGRELYRKQIPAPIEAAFRIEADRRVTRISGHVPAARRGQLYLWFALQANGVHPKLDAQGKDVSTSAQAQVVIRQDGAFVFDVPRAWQRYQSVGFAATTLARPYGCSTVNDCNGFVAAGFSPEPGFWIGREAAYRKGKQ